MKRNVTDLINEELFKKSFASLETINRNANIYIDANHLKISIDHIIHETQFLHNNMFRRYNLGICPKLEINDHVYSEFIHKIIKRIERYIKEEIQKLLSEENILFLEPNDWLWPAISENATKFHNIEDLFKKTKYAKSWGWDKKELKVLDISTYINFFASGDYDKEQFSRDIWHHINKISDKQKKLKLTKYSDAAIMEKSSDNSTKSFVENNRRHKAFKLALRNFDKNWQDVVSENHQGITKYQIDRESVRVNFNEKAVDTKLVMKVMEDLYKEKDAFCVMLTNDTDFQPLFEKIKEENLLVWIYGGDPKTASRELKATADPFFTQNIFDLTLGEDYKLDGFRNIFQTNWWSENQLNKLVKNLDVLYDGYSNALFESHSEKSYGRFLQKSEKEYQQYMEELYKDAPDPELDPGGYVEFELNLWLGAREKYLKD